MSIRVLLKKELMETLRTYRVAVIPIVFLIFGLASPIIAKMLPQILESTVGEIKIEIPPPTWVDAFDQFFKSLTQIGLLAVILTMMGAVTDEKARGTAVMVLSRPVSRYAFIFTKFLANTLLLVFSLLVSYLGCVYNTYVLFPDFSFPATLNATAVFSVYVIFIGALTIFASTITNTNIAAGGIAITGFFVSSILPSLHRIFARYSPGALQRFVTGILHGTSSVQDPGWAILITVALSLFLVALGSYIFATQEL